MQSKENRLVSYYISGIVRHCDSSTIIVTSSLNFNINDIIEHDSTLQPEVSFNPVMTEKCFWTHLVLLYGWHMFLFLVYLFILDYIYNIVFFDLELHCHDSNKK